MKRIAGRIAAIVMTAATLPLIPVTGRAAESRVIKVACVGDSITQGLGNVPYPSRLGELLGDGYRVENFGLYGTTACNNTGRPYTSCEDSCYQKSLDFAPDVVVIMLGTNDGNEASISNAEKYFKDDMKKLINSYLSLESSPEVYLVTSPHAYLSGNAAVNTKIVQMQHEIAEEMDLPLVDMNKYTENIPEYFPDGLHCNDTGYYIIAQNIYEQVFGGKVADVTVKTAPGADVKLGEYEGTADSDGVFGLRMAHGVRLLTVCADGFENALAPVDISGDCTISCELSKTVNLAAGAQPYTEGAADASAAFDGDLSTGWQESERVEGSCIGAVFDRGRTFSSVRLYWETSTRAAAEENGYTVEYRDGEEWIPVKNPVYSFGASDYGITMDTVTFDSVAADAVRVVINGFSDEKYAPKLYEMCVYGENKGEAVIAVAPADPTPDANTENGAESDKFPGWILPAAVAAAAVIIAACVLWVVFTLKKRG